MISRILSLSRHDFSYRSHLHSSKYKSLVCEDQNDSTIVFPADILDYNTTAIVRGSVFLDDKEWGSYINTYNHFYFLGYKFFKPTGAPEMISSAAELKDMENHMWTLDLNSLDSVLSTNVLKVLLLMLEILKSRACQFQTI